MLSGDIGCFANIVRQVDQKRRLESDPIGRSDVGVAAEGSRPLRLLLAREMQLPSALANGLQMDSQIIEEGLIGVRFFKLSVEEMGDVIAINHAVGRQLRTGQRRKGWQDIQSAGEIVARRTLRNTPRSPENRRNAYTAFKRRDLTAAQRPG